MATSMTKEEVEQSIAELEAKMLEIGIIGTQATLEEEGSRLSTTNDMENVANSLAYFKKLLLELENPTLIPSNFAKPYRSSKKKRADFEW